jgi:predicted phosphodiesterase
MKKIGVFADIHSNYLVFKKAIEDAKSKNVDLFLFLGDYITDGFDDNKILDIIKNLNMHAIIGNREQSIIEYDKFKDEDWLKYDQYKSMFYSYKNLSKDNLDFIKSLDICKIINVDGRKICMSHSNPYKTRGYITEDSFEEFDKFINDFNADVYLFGHEHKYFNTTYRNCEFINSGSIGLPTNGLPFSYVLLTLNDNITVEKIGIDYDYDELEKYYKQSEYYDFATIWCKLILRIMKEGYDFPYYFINKIKEIAQKDNIDVSKNIPNELFKKCYEDFIENKEIKIKGD